MDNSKNRTTLDPSGTNAVGMTRKASTEPRRLEVHRMRASAATKPSRNDPNANVKRQQWWVDMAESFRVNEDDHLSVRSTIDIVRRYDGRIPPHLLTLIRDGVIEISSLVYFPDRLLRRLCDVVAERYRIDPRSWSVNPDSTDSPFIDTLKLTKARRLINELGINDIKVIEGWDQAIQDYDAQKTKATPVLRGAYTEHIVPEDKPMLFYDRYYAHFFRGLLLQYVIVAAIDGADSPWIKTATGMLGYGVIHHHAVSEFGLSLTDDSKIIPDVIIDALMKLQHLRLRNVLRSPSSSNDMVNYNLNDYHHVTASFPRGKNSGMPLLVKGSDRVLNDCVMAINAGLAASLIRGYPINDMFQGLCMQYVVFSRYQRSGKGIPVTYDGRQYTTFGVEPRRRIINSTPKPVAMAVKPFVKWLTEFHLRTPEFTQSRTELLSRIIAAHDVVAIDASRFDLRNGGRKLEQVVRAIFTVAKGHYDKLPDTVLDVMLFELGLPTFVDYDDSGERVVGSSSLPSLKSGASMTSRAGCLLNLCYDMFVTFTSKGFTTSDELVDYYVQHTPSAILGDDLIKFFPTRKDADAYMQHICRLDELGMDYGVEHPTKFLGYLINDPRVAIVERDGIESGKRGLYHASNPLDNILFPERFNKSAVASLCARYVILRDREALRVLNSMTSMMRDDNVLARVYQEVWDKIVPWARIHYNDHPYGKARVWFDTLPDPSVGDGVASKVRVKFDDSLDDILYIIGHGSEFDFNLKLVGLSVTGDKSLPYGAGDDDDDQDDETAVSATLEVALDRTKASVMPTLMERLKSSVNSKAFVKYNAILDIFKSTSDEEFVHRWRQSLPLLGRQVVTDFGSFFVGNI